ncbi:hypothetical protein BJ166DRAFT_291010 [Pestalotiopsis sp. NC0098]|nr:hypothetical protein BJ166DRAFT_291010 [Pestalotiopsis sp. NC0098]
METLLLDWLVGRSWGGSTLMLWSSKSGSSMGSCLEEGASRANDGMVARNLGQAEEREREREKAGKSVRQAINGPPRKRCSSSTGSAQRQARKQPFRGPGQSRGQAADRPGRPWGRKGGCQALQLPNSSRRQIPRANWNPSRLMRQVDMWEPRVLAGLTWNTPISASETDCDKLFFPSFFFSRVASRRECYNHADSILHCLLMTVVFVYYQSTRANRNYPGPCWEVCYSMTAG